MKSRSTITAACIAVAIAATSCGKSSPESADVKGTTSGVSNATSSKPIQTSPKSVEQKQVPKNLVDDNYRATVTKWGKETLFTGMDDTAAFNRARQIDMHYAYLAFTECYPDSSHKSDVIKAMNGYSYVETPAGKTSISFADLAIRYGFNGEKSVYCWNNVVAAMQMPNGSLYIISKECNDPNSGIRAGGNTGTMIAPGGVCYGNLQIQNNGFEQIQDGLAFTEGTRIIFKLPIGR